MQTPPALSRLATVALLAALSACGDSPVRPPSDFNLAVETDRAEYDLPSDSLAFVTLRNASTVSVYLPMDSYVVYERFESGAWRDPFAWFVVDGIGRSFSVAPGASQTDVLRVWFYLPNEPGIYRFRYFVYADPDLRSLLPLEQRVSAPFIIRL